MKGATNKRGHKEILVVTETQAKLAVLIIFYFL